MDLSAESMFFDVAEPTHAATEGPFATHAPLPIGFWNSPRARSRSMAWSMGFIFVKMVAIDHAIDYAIDR